MTVLEEERRMSSGLSLGDRYITPEYLAPLPTSPESKNEKSPLQLLAQTCSQIGADNNVSSKILSSSSTDKLKNKAAGAGEDKKKAGGDSSSPNINVSDAKPVAFKPYATTDHDKAGGAAAGRNPSSPKTSTSSSPVHLSSASRRDSSSASKTSTPVSSTSGTSPTISSGIEVLTGGMNGKESSLGKLGGLDLSNPAFRPPGLPGFPTSLGQCHPPGGHPGVCRDPYCRDPTCPTANYNAYLARLSSMGGAGLPPGYLELLEAYKMYLPGGGSMAGLPPPPTSVPSPSTASPLGPGGPYICNWMNGREYCGKRYTNAEELLVHLKTHTNLSVSDSHLSSLSSSPSSAAAAAAYSSLFAAAGGGGQAAALAAAQAASAIRGPYPSALSLAASRYSPYGKPGFPSPLPPSLAGMGLPGGGPPGLPPSMGGLSPYLSSLGAAANNPLSMYGLYGARL